MAEVSAPTPVVRAAVYLRDDHRCVSCNTSEGLTFQHRRRVGMGGSKIRPGVVDGLTLCLTCNQAAEADLQTVALVNGWKVRSWASDEHVPVYYPHLFQWFRLDGVTRKPIPGVVALDMMCAVYGDQYTTWFRSLIERHTD